MRPATAAFMEQMQEQAHKRRRRVVELRQKGLTWVEIGLLLGTTRQNAWRLYEEAKRRGEALPAPPGKG